MKCRNHPLKVGDVLIILVAVALVVFLFSRYFIGKASDELLLITGKYSQESYPLDRDAVIEVRGPLGITRVVIQGGEAWIEESPCREKICMKMGKVKRTGDQVVCIPNGVVVERAGGSGYVDGVSR
ncbi:MAG: hypothetical protein AMS17_16050 [Spirochaetes bacterium DG_61]|jgi:hypothetical protein|nr:MAG: hypothetical protein AMS17_16050 [Spirochaetes bacterium DG_61]